MKVICDTETNAIENPDKLWIIGCKDINTGKVYTWNNLHCNEEEKKSFIRFASKVSCWVGHNFINYDQPVIKDIIDYEIPTEKIVDTLVCSRLLNFNVEGGHSLEAIGLRLGVHKGNFKDFSAYSQEMLEYCIQDLEVTYSYYLKILPFLTSPKWKDSLRLEHDIAVVCQELHTNGFTFDIPKAISLSKEIEEKLKTIDNTLSITFPPKPKFIREITPRETKFGTLHRGDFRWLSTGDLTPFSSDAPFSLISFEDFNPGSPKQIVERLHEAGWAPYEKTKGYIQAERDNNTEKLPYYEKYGWKVSEANLATLPKDAPEGARKLVERLLLASRYSTLTEWINAYKPLKNSTEGLGRIHAKFHHIGAWTHRMSHSNPNMANIPAEPSEYAHEMRSLWTVPKGKLLVGVDADGIQLRILAHYMNDKEFTNALIKGRKEDGTDAHTLNKQALGDVCASRTDAKTFIYAWLLGAGHAKVANILGCNINEAREASQRFLEYYPGLKNLKEFTIPRDASRGYFIGFDGRAVLCNNEHLMLAGYLQNGESTIMKKANILWKNQLISEGIPFKQVDFVHDEWQTEVEEDIELAKYVASVQAESIRKVGELFNLNCPLAGSFINDKKELTIGYNWSQTH